MPSRLTEIWQAREKVREEPPTDEMLVALLEILKAFRALNIPENQKALNPFVVVFDNRPSLVYTGSEISNNFLEREFFDHDLKVILYVKTRVGDSGRQENFLDLVVLKPHIDTLEDGWTYTLNERGHFDIQRHRGFFSSEQLIETIETFKAMVKLHPTADGDYALRRALEQFDQAVYRLDHEGDAELIEELVKLAETFSGKIRGLMSHIDSLKKTGRAALKRQASAAQEEMDRVVHEAAARVEAAKSEAFLETRRTVAAKNRATAAETKAAEAEARAKATEARAAEAEAGRRQALAQHRDAMASRDRFSKDRDDVLTELGKARDALAGFKQNRIKQFVKEFTERLQGIPKRAERLAPLWQKAERIKMPLLLGGALVTAGVGVDQTFLDSREVREAVTEREAVQVLMREGGRTDGRLTSVHYRVPYALALGSSMDYWGYDTPMPLTDSDIQPGGGFYYGAQAMRALNEDFSLSGSACRVIQNRGYMEPDEKWIQRLDDWLCGIGLSSTESTLISLNHGRLSQGVYGPNNLAWIHWGFHNGVQDERMTIGHQLVAATLFENPWSSSSQFELAYLDDQGEMTRLIFPPSSKKGWDSLGDDRWRNRDTGEEIDLSDGNWVNWQDHQWEQTQARAEAVLDLLIENSAIPDPLLDRVDVLNQIAGARPKPWDEIAVNAMNRGHYSPDYDYADNPGEGIASIFDSPVEEAIRELGHYEFKDSWTPPYAYGDLKDELASVTLTIDPDMQAKLMEIVEEEFYQNEDFEDFFEEGFRVMVLNDEGEIVAFFDGAPLHYVKPSSRHWAPFSYPIDGVRNWFFKFSPSGYGLSDCYSSGHDLQDWFGMITDIRKGHPVARPHIVKSYTLRNGEIVDISPVYSENQAACARDLADGGRAFKSFETELNGSDYERSFSINGVGEVPYFRIALYLGDDVNSEEIVTVWTRFEDDDPDRPDPYYTVILSNTGNKYSYYATGQILKGIYQIRHDRQASQP